VLDLFGARKDAPALLRRHVIQLSEVVAQALLRLCRKIAEARFILKRTLLVRQRKVAMAIHPLGQVFLVLLLAILLWTLARRVHRWVPSHLSRPPHGRRLGRNHGCCCRQQNGSESWS
jgi:hypothetical protein